MTTNTGVTGYYSEMGEKRPADAQIDAQLSHTGKHWFLTTPLELKGRGITKLGTYTPEQLTQYAQHKVGWHKYKATETAYRAICEQYKVACQFLL